MSTCLSRKKQKPSILTYNTTSLYICFLKQTSRARTQTVLSRRLKKKYKIQKLASTHLWQSVNHVYFHPETTGSARSTASFESLKTFVKTCERKKKNNNVDPFPFKVARVFVCVLRERERERQEVRDRESIKEGMTKFRDSIEVLSCNENTNLQKYYCCVKSQVVRYKVPHSFLED